MFSSRDAFENDFCPVRDELLGELYRSSQHGLPKLVESVSPEVRAMRRISPKMVLSRLRSDIGAPDPAVALTVLFERPDEVQGPLCFKCRKRDARPVETMLTVDDFVVWRCLACGTEGQISNWQDSFWDLSAGRPDA